MDKNEYRAKLDEINDLVDRQDYKGALKIVDTVDWRRVRSARTLCMIGEIYEANKRYDESRKLLLLAHQRAPIGKTVLYRLVELSIKMGNFNEASDYYKQFVEISPNDNSRYILKYKIYRAKRSPIEEQITILQEYKSREYTERWAYELARLYAKAGMQEACIEECDDLILWFSEGKYVIKAMELKMKYTALTASQQEKYDKRFTNSPSVAAAAAANAVSAATEAAAKLVENAGVSAAGAANTASQDKEIEDILKSIVIGDMADTPAADKSEETAETAVPVNPEIEIPVNLQEKVAQGIRDVFQTKASAEAGREEAAATQEKTEVMSPEEKGYIVKDLEPEDITKTSEKPGFKPFHLGGNMTAKVKAEAPKSEMFQSEGADAAAFKTDLKAMEIDLEALLAETASELAQAVAEEKGQTSEEQKKEETQETPKAEEVKEEPEAEEVKQEASVLPAPAAARAAIVAESLSEALAAKAEEFEKLAGEELQETEKPTEAEEAAETEEPAEAEEAAETEEPAEAEEVTETEESAEAEEAAETEEPAEAEEVIEAEEPAEAEEVIETEEPVEVEEVPETGESAEIQETSEAEEPKDNILEKATKEILVEEVKEQRMEIDFSRVLEQELEDTVLSAKDDSHMKRVTGSVVTESERKPMPFNTAVEGLMRHHLTEEEHRRLFTYFAPIPGMTQQINEALNIAQESACAKTSRSGNIVVTGREGSGKTRLSEGLIKALCKERQMEGAKVAFIDAKHLNKKDPIAVVGKLAGGFLVVEHAGSLSPEVVENMSKAMEFKTNRLTVILEDLKPGIRSLEEKYPDFMKKFDSRITIPVFTNDELVSFAKTYAKELGYKIDAMAVLAIYTLIGDNQNEENPVAIGMVREMMDDAIKRAAKKGRKTGKKVGKRHLDEDGRIMLYEKDFDV